MLQLIASKNVTSKACHLPIRDNGPRYRIASVALGSITILLVLIRLVFKQFFSATKRLTLDDQVLVGALAIRITCTALNIAGVGAHGLGRDVWTLPLEELPKYLEYLYILEILYLAEVSLIKLVLSLFYLQIFPGTTIRRLLYGTIVCNILYGVVLCTTAIFQCTPVSYFWTQYTESGVSGHCVNINAFGWSNAAVSVALDIWMIGIPLSQIPKLQLQWVKKVGVIIMFLLGSL
jgi:hypothetical protein